MDRYSIINLLPKNIPIISACIAGVSLLILACIVTLEFSESRKEEKIVNKRNLVAVLTMSLFFIFEFILGQSGIGKINVPETVQNVWALIGCGIIVLGVAINLIARVQLGSAWSNDIAVYRGQILIKNGLYKFIRHPLYSSILLIALGLSVLYLNYLSGIFLILVFVPMIYYRAISEEKFLQQHLPDYNNYMKSTSRFFPFSFRSFFSIKEVVINPLALTMCRATTVLILVLSMILESWWLVILAIALMFYSTISSIEYSPLVVLYSKIAIKFGLNKKETVDVDAIRFAQGLGSLLLLTAVLLFFVYKHYFGAWIFVSIVLFSTAFGSFGYCLGAYIYFGLRKIYQKYAK